MTKSKRIDPSDLYDDLEKIKSALSDATQDVKAKAGDLLSQSYENVKERTQDTQDIISEYVAEKPLQSLSIAALVGAVIGYICHK